MIASRFSARSAPRAIRRFSSAALRRPTPLCARLLQASSAAATDSVASRIPSLRAAFSSSIRLGAPAGSSDAELITKLKSEINLEKEMKGHDVMPTSVKDFMDNSQFKVIDTPGLEEVVLEREFGDEKIRVTFSISDVNAIDNDPDFSDQALADEDDGSGEDMASKTKAAAEAAETEELDGENGEEEQTFPSQLTITIEKPNKGALLVEATAQDGLIIIDSVYHYKSIKHAHAKTADVSFERDTIYAGPPFGNLDEDLQVLMERYLDERGINSALAVFVPDYMDLKEQREYENWLGNVKGFLEA